MKGIDYLKALGVAISLLVVNVIFAILVVAVYAFFIEPGQPDEFYEEAALRIVPWCSNIFGAALFCLAGYLLTRHRPDRNGIQFAAFFTLCYVVIDSASVGFANIADVLFLLFMLIKLAAALLGVMLAKRSKKSTAPQSGENL